MEGSAYFRVGLGAPLSRTVPYLPSLHSQPTLGSNLSADSGAKIRLGPRDHRPPIRELDFPGMASMR